MHTSFFQKVSRSKQGLRSLITSFAIASSALTNTEASAADGTWTNALTGGLWSDTANWSGATIADGAGSTANFNTLDITADNTLSLDSARTIGGLIFGDTTVGTAGSWILNNNGSALNILTLGVGSGTPTLTVNALGTGKVAIISAEIGGTQGLSKAGAGELQLKGVNTYSGLTAVGAGTLTLQGDATAGAGSPGGSVLSATGFTVAQGAIFKLVNDATNGNSTNRVADTAAITLNGGSFNFGASTAASTTFAETVGQLNIASGGQNRVITTAATGAGSSSTLTFSSLSRTAGTAMSFSTTTNLGTSNANRIFFTAAPTVDDGSLIGGWAAAGSADFAAYNVTDGVKVAAYAATNANEATWSEAQNAKVTLGAAGLLTLTSNRQVNALAYVQTGGSTSSTINLGGFTLRTESGGVLISGGTSNGNITNGSLTAGQGDNTNAELFLMISQANSRPATVSANIVDNGTGVVSLVANGGINGAGGIMIISGNNTYTGTTTIAGGVLQPNTSTALNNSKALTIATGATLSMPGVTATIDGLSGMGAIGIGTAVGTVNILNIGGANGSATYAGTVTSTSSRTLSLLKTGTGSQTFSGTDTRPSGGGSVTAQAGTLQFARTASLYNSTTSLWTAGNIRVASGATLAFNVGGAGEFSTTDVTTLLTNLSASTTVVGTTLTGGIVTGLSGNGMNAGSSLGFDTTNAVGGSFTIANTIANTTGAAGGSRGLNKLGNGTLVLTGTNTYTGATTVTAGALQVGSAGMGTTGTGALNLTMNGQLLGTGTVRASSVTAVSGSSIYAGDGTAQGSYGTLTFNPGVTGGTFDFQSGSTVNLGINSGGTSDLLNFIGDGSQVLNFNSNLTVGASGFVPVAPETFNLFDWASLSVANFNSRFLASSYSGLLLGNGDDNLGFDLPDISGSGYAWDISQLTTNGTISVAVVPEPARALLLLGGIAALTLRRRRSQGGGR